MKYTAILVLLLLAARTAKAQPASFFPVRIGPMVGHATVTDPAAAGKCIGWSVGEVFHKTWTAGGLQLCPTFWQPENVCGGSVETIEPFGKPLDVSIFPNPASESWNVAFSGPLGGALRVSLFDAQGRLLKWEELPCGASAQAFNASDLAAGSYVLRLSDQQGRWQQSFVVQKR